MPDAPAKPKPRRWWRWLRRLTGMMLIGVVLLTGTVWWAYENRLSLTNRALEYLDPLGATITFIDFDRSGNIDLRQLKVVDKETGATLLQLPRLKAKIEWANALSGHVQSLTVEQPDIRIEQAFLEKLRERQQSPKPVQPAVPDAAGRSWQVDKLDIQNAKVHFMQKGGAVVEITTNYQAEGLALSAAGKLSSGEQELTMAGGLLKTPGAGEPPVNLQRLHLKGRIKDGILDLDHIALQQPALVLTPELLVMLGLQKKEGAPPTQSASMIHGVHIGEVSVTGLSLNASGFQGGNASGYLFPDLRLQLDQSAKNVVWNAEAGNRFGSLELLLRDYRVTVPEQAGHIKGATAKLSLGPWNGKGPWRIEEVTLTKPDALWTAALKAAFAGTARSPEQPAVAGADGQSFAALVQQGGITEANIVITDAGLMPFELRTKGDLALSKIQVDDTGWHSKEAQSLTLTNTSLTFPSDGSTAPKKAFFSLESAELEVNPDAWAKTKHVNKLVLIKPTVLLRDGNTPWMEAPAALPAAVKAEDKPSSTQTPWWQQVSFDDLVLQEGDIEVLALAPKPMDTKARLNITTETAVNGKPLHRIWIQDFAMKLPTLSKLPFPIASASVLQGAVKLPDVWQTHHVEELRLESGSMEAGEALMGLFEPDKETLKGANPLPAPNPLPPALAAPAASGPPWTVGHLAVEQSTVTIANLVPGLPTLKFGVVFDIKDAPLFPEDLAKNVAPQQVELANITIPSPYEPLRPVALLDSLFLHFTLDGLMRKEIEKVEIVSPTLYVGEDLFWYVDYYRKYAATDSKKAPGAAEVAAVGQEEALRGLASNVIDKEPATSQAAWSVKRLQVHSGKMVLAPKGKPLKGFREPFPFNIDTQLVRGTLEATMDIPKDTYTIEQYKLQFDGTRGHVSFNLPLKQKDNNMVETFEVDSIRWKDIRTGKAFLTVTYDALGIYAKFGAEAYEGYVNGEFNVYLDDNYHWDGWMGAKNLQTHDITKVLTPGYFLMDGKVEATLVAQGSKDELYQADGSFKNHTPGRFSINALNDLVKDLPGDWSDLEKQISQMGVETLRDFDYDNADAKCRFYGREGNGYLHFTGPKGSRKFDINVYDHRWKTDPPLVQE